MGLKKAYDSFLIFFNTWSHWMSNGNFPGFYLNMEFLFKFLDDIFSVGLGLGAG